ncbi:hypothetical protein BDR26DRAFT_861490 [Obelidium mucronatum]|nr:hypothetical protein BDR26DRAFT_861490 [Obelidium mucronatum]
MTIQSQTQPFLLRQAIASDASQISDLINQSWIHTYADTGIMPSDFVANINSTRCESLANDLERLEQSKSGIDAEFNVYVVAVVPLTSNSVVGVCQIQATPGEPDETTGCEVILETIHVDPRYYGTGVAKALVGSGIRLFQEWYDRLNGTDESKLYLSLGVKAFRSNYRALSFYKKLGAVHVRDFVTSAYGGREREAVALKWESIHSIKE